MNPCEIQLYHNLVLACGRWQKILIGDDGKIKLIVKLKLGKAKTLVASHTEQKVLEILMALEAIEVLS